MHSVKGPLKLAESAQDQKEMQGILLDAISEQIRGMQSITKLLTHKLEKVIRTDLPRAQHCQKNE